MQILKKILKSKNEKNVKVQSIDILDDDLPWGWITENAGFIKPRDHKLFSLSIDISKANTIDEEITLLKEFIKFYYEYQSECNEKGKYFQKYFSDMHMHCRNSQNSNFEFVKPKEERLKYIEENYERLILEEKQKKEHLNGIDMCIENYINDEPGIIQSELVKKFDSDIKQEITSILYFWEKEGKIIRKKNGRSYNLYMND